MANNESTQWVLERADFDRLFDALKARGYTVVGPTVRDQAIVYEELDGAGELPVGWTDEQDGGHYRMRRRDDDALFGYVVGPESWKKYLHPPRVRVAAAKKLEDGGISFETGDEDLVPQLAFLGVRSCELHAIAIQDRVFMGGGYTDSDYAKRRRASLLIAVNCGTSGGTCFCVSMDTGPEVREGAPFDIALTEVLDGGRHHFVMRGGSDRGQEILDELPLRKATSEDVRESKEIVTKTAGNMGRKMKSEGVKELLYENLMHPRWAEVAERCLTCANCTMVCPTCFCTTVEDVTDLTGEHAERWKTWDSCFTLGFSHMHGGGVRQSARSRYRQWLTHKLATWHDQFGSSGCVGCGRCITWCPVGIDITEEVEAIRSEPCSKTDMNKEAV